MPNQSTSRYILTALAIILVITAFILVALNAIQMKKRQVATPTGSTRPLMLKTNVTTAGGTIRSVSGMSFTLKLDQLGGEALAPASNDIRTVIVTSTTVMTRTVQKKPEELNKEMSAYTASLKTPLKPGSPPRIVPLPYSIEKLTIADLKVGESVTLTGPSGFTDSDTLRPSAIAVR